ICRWLVPSAAIAKIFASSSSVIFCPLFAIYITTHLQSKIKSTGLKLIDKSSVNFISYFA
ncbi:hypothetical protein, partial [Aneurinibacillus thermoaerophilus]|uniref:hypothetical protein n=1 Tax=Aneurinibacillus thermoaerophilus TaxID=143495 RepID=UPI002E1DA0E9|nr:hypothetical protein [Aneurinibacillus thermoaerophilus]